MYKHLLAAVEFSLNPNLINFNIVRKIDKALLINSYFLFEVGSPFKLVCLNFIANCPAAKYVFFV